MCWSGSYFSVNDSVILWFWTLLTGLCRIEIDTKLPIFGDQKWVIWICSFNIPMAPGKTRSIVCSARNFFQFTMPGKAWWQVHACIVFPLCFIFPLWCQHYLMLDIFFLFNCWNELLVILFFSWETAGKVPTVSIYYCRSLLLHHIWIYMCSVKSWYLPFLFAFMYFWCSLSLDGMNIGLQIWSMMVTWSFFKARRRFS